MPQRRPEQRKAKRIPRRNAAWIVLASGAPRIPCVLWDISDSGARVAAARANTLPRSFVCCWAMTPSRFAFVA
jgi:hypothetical protein